MFSVASNFCLSVCEQHYSNCYECIMNTFYGGVLGGKRKNWSFFLGLLKSVK